MALRGIDIYISSLPKIQFGGICSGFIAARNEVRLAGLNFPKSRKDISESFDSSRVASWSDQDEIVVHDRIAPHAEPLSHELFLRRSCMDENDVGVAPPTS